MATVLLFHHARGQTPAFLAFADALRRAGHSVHAPDLFDGLTFPTIEEGVAYAETIGFESILQRGVAAADGLPAGIVYAGFSLGVLPAQKLAQTRPGARGALLCYSCVPVAMLSPAWPAGVPVAIHIKEEDKWAEEDLVAARELARDVPGAELFVYPGSGHYFAEAGFVDYDEASAAQLMERTLDFLDRVG
jgi:dienelactone hydrolase